MGILRETVVKRTDNGEQFKAHSWSRDDGSFEVFWYEKGVRMCFIFDFNGKQVGMWKQYEMFFT